MNKKKFFIVAIGGFVLAWAATGISFAAADPPSASMTIAPSEVNVAGSGSNEVFTITKEITGSGGSSTTPMDVIFALDSSGSMSWNDPDNERISAARTFLGLMTMPPSQAGVVSWDNNIDFTQALTDNSTTVDNALSSIDSGGLTNLDEGLEATLDLLAPFYPASSPSRKCVVIFLTDGNGTYTISGNLGSQADRAVDMGCTIYGIGLGSSADMMPLVDMTDTTGGKAYSVDTVNLDDVFKEIYEEISTVPYNVTVQETMQDYIEIIPGSCTPVPDYGPVNGRVIWEDIGMLADGDSAFPADETVTLTCEARCTKGGKNIPVNILADSYMTYEDKDGNTGEIEIPQAFITSNEPPVTNNAHASTDCFRTRLPGYTDHRLEEVTIEGVTDPDGDPVTIEITGITSDEPITSGGCEDARISSDADTAMLRIERYGTNGRVYEINFTASDGKAVSQGSVQVVIPYDDRARFPRYLPPRYPCEEVIDDGQSYDATAEESCLPRIKPPYFPVNY
ncbi:VWA domain-containing protein [Desulfobulbus sp. TB]|nr:VWA domain-containing protein [Desulfobulbus sp. TB]